MKFIVGIDEAGKGPLAGPVSIGVFLDLKQRTKDPKFLEEHFPKLRDSKKLSEKKREDFFRRMRTLKEKGEIDFAVALVHASLIDRVGISKAIKGGIAACFKKLKLNPKECQILLDGGLKAPLEFTYQETIIKGDELEPAISLASIAAKVTRDRHMISEALKYPEYGFEVHKGYGTEKHRKAIKEKGTCPIHRVSFCQNIF